MYCAISDCFSRFATNTMCALKVYFFNWNVIALQRYVGFRCSTSWIVQKYTYIPTLLSLLPTHPSRSPPSRELSLCSIAASHWLSWFTHSSVCVYVGATLSVGLPITSPLLCPQVHSLCLCLCSCPENRFISTFFVTCFSLSDFTLYDRLWIHPHQFSWLNFVPLYGWVIFHSHWPEWAIIKKKSANNKCRRGCGEKEMILHYWWECKLVQPLWRTGWRFLKKLKHRINIWPSSSTVGNIPCEKWTQKHTCVAMFTAALLNDSQDMEAT